MVDIIRSTDAVAKAEQIVDRSEYIFLGDVLGSKLCNSLTNLVLDEIHTGIANKTVIICSGDDLIKNRVSYLLAGLNATVGKVVSENELGANGIIGKYFYFFTFLGLEKNLVYKAVLNSVCNIAVDEGSLFSNDFTGGGVNDCSGKSLVFNSSCKRKLLVVLISSNGSKVISLGIEEEVVYEKLGTLNERGLAGTESLVNFLKWLIPHFYFQ